MSILLLFSSDIERDAAFPAGLPAGVRGMSAGVGLVDAAAGTSRIVSGWERAPDSVLFLGTCGAYRGSSLKIGDIAVVTGACLGSGDTATGAMRFPGLLPSVISTNAAMADDLLLAAEREGAGAVAVRAACTLGITENDELAATLASETGAGVENLEVFSVIRSVETTGVPVGALLGVTNIVGAGGGRDWAANYKAMMRRVGELAETYIMHTDSARN